VFGLCKLLMLYFLDMELSRFSAALESFITAVSMACGGEFGSIAGSLECMAAGGIVVGGVVTLLVRLVTLMELVVPLVDGTGGYKLGDGMAMVLGMVTICGWCSC
jgi:hypothetical protein